jgi:hypothetical protein
MKYYWSTAKMAALIAMIVLSVFISPAAFAQSTGNSKDEIFQNELLDHLVGKWDAAATVHREKFTLNFEVAWVMNHQYLHIHFKSNEVVPWLKIHFEGEFFFGYNKTTKRYIVHEMNVHGDKGTYEGFCYADQTGNEFKIMKKWGSDSLLVQRFTWEPTSKSWHIHSNFQIDGKEGQTFLDMKLTAIKQSTN